MAIAAQERERMLAAEGGDPNIVRGNRFAHSLQFESDVGVVVSGGFTDIQYQAVTKQVREPPFVGQTVSRLRNSIAIFAQSNFLRRTPRK